MKRYANVVAQVELIMPVSDMDKLGMTAIVTQYEIETALIDAIKSGKWVSVSLPRIVYIRPDSER